MYWDIQPNCGGFDFSKFERNKTLSSKNKDLKHTYTKTGTTIVGCIFKDGVVLGADTRATMGSIVGDPECMKIHYLAPNIYCCGAGTAADTFNVTQMMSSELEMQRLYTGRESRISHVEARLTNHLFRYMGHIGAALIVGGVDVKGPQLVSISPYGNSMRLPFVTMGSGSLAAMAVFEKKYRDGLEEQECIDLVKDAIEAGIFHDLGSGSNVNVFIVKRNGCEKKLNYRVYNKKAFTESETYKFPKGTTEVIEEIERKWKNIEIVDEAVPMDIA